MSRGAIDEGGQARNLLKMIFGYNPVPARPFLRDWLKTSQFHPRCNWCDELADYSWFVPENEDCESGKNWKEYGCKYCTYKKYQPQSLGTYNLTELTHKGNHP